VGVAPSGAGKDHARKCIQAIAHAAGIGDQYIGGERIASGPGLVSALQKHPAKLFMLDEFGLYLASMTSSSAAPHLRDLMATLMCLYSSASVVYRGIEYADQKARPRAEIVQPHCCLYGTTTPDQFYAALTSMQGLDGSLARFVVVHAPQAIPDRRRVDLAEPPSRLVDSVRAMVALKPQGGNLAGLGGAAVDPQLQTVRMLPEVRDAWEQLDDQARGRAENAAGRAIYARTAENTARLALVAAISNDPVEPLIGVDEFRWAREFALWSSNRLVAEVARKVSDSKAEAETKRVAEIVREAGQLSRSDLLRRCFFLRRRELEDVLSMLLQSGVLVEQRVSTPGKPGPAAITYRHTGA